MQFRRGAAMSRRDATRPRLRADAIMSIIVTTTNFYCCYYYYYYYYCYYYGHYYSYPAEACLVVGSGMEGEMGKDSEMRQRLREKEEQWRRGSSKTEDRRLPQCT